MKWFTAEKLAISDFFTVLMIGKGVTMSTPQIKPYYLLSKSVNLYVFFGHFFCPAMLSAINVFKIVFRPNLCLRPIVKQCLRHQALYSCPFCAISICEGPLRAINHLRCLLPITTTVNNSDEVSFSVNTHFT